MTNASHHNGMLWWPVTITEQYQVGSRGHHITLAEQLLGLALFLIVSLTADIWCSRRLSTERCYLFLLAATQTGSSFITGLFTAITPERL